MKGSTAINALRVICGLVICIGLGAALDGFLSRQSITLFAFDVPSWMVGVSAAYMGLRYWRRIPELEKQAGPDASFSWAKLSPFRSR